MRTPHCAFRNRLIALSICLCALLAFSSTLSADAVLVVGGASPGSYAPWTNLTGTKTSGVWMADGPYAATLKINNVTQTNTMFFCLTGNQQVGASETGGVYTPYSAPTPPSPTATPTSNIAYEEAAFLASMMLTKAANDNYSVSSNGSSMDVHSTISNNPISLSAFEAQVLGPIQMAIWEIMGTKPYLPNTTTQEADDLNKLTANFVSDAETMYTGYSYSNVQVFILGGTSKCSGQDFISVSTLTPTPEPGTMVLFGAGALLMGLGCVRKRLARRPR